MKKNLVLAGFIAITVLVTGCGKGNTPPPLPPAPPPTTNGGFPILGGGSCGASGGVQPLNPQNLPYVGVLSPSQYGTNSLTANFSYTQQRWAGNLNPAIVGQAQVVFADLPLAMQMMFGGNFGQQQAPSTFCVSSNNPFGGGVSNGRFDEYSGILNIVLQGTVQVSPPPLFQGGPMQPPQPLPVSVTFGQGDQQCWQPSRLDSRNFAVSGCVKIDMGRGRFQQWYMAQ